MYKFGVFLYARDTYISFRKWENNTKFIGLQFALQHYQ